LVDRTVTAGVISKVESRAKKTAGFVLLDFDTDPVYVWTGTRTYASLALPSESSHDYLGVGSLGFIDGLMESPDTINGVTLQMAGIGNELLANALDQEYQGRTAKIWIAQLDADDVIIPNALLLFGGQMDVMTLVDGDGTGVISIQCESRDATLNKASESLYTDEEQQRVFPGDIGLSFVRELQGKTLTWGEKSAATIPNTNPNTHPRYWR
jgi:hypothetical protein